MGFIIGALVITYFITEGLNYLTLKKWKKPIANIMTFVIASIIVLIITNFTIGIEKGALYYIPVLLIWLIVGIIKKPKNN